MFHLWFQLQFNESYGGHGAVADSGPGNPVPCYSVETLLAALSVNKVDFFSLDVEGQELAILKTIPLEKVTFSRDESLHLSYHVGWNYLSSPKLQRCSCWSLGMNMWFHPTLNWACNDLTIPFNKIVFSWNEPEQTRWFNWVYLLTSIVESITVASSQPCLVCNCNWREDRQRYPIFKWLAMTWLKIRWLGY